MAYKSTSNNKQYKVARRCLACRAQRGLLGVLPKHIWSQRETSPNQVLTHAARAAAKQLNKQLFSHSVAARAKGPGQGKRETTTRDEDNRL